jgi:hypothetical protein
MNAVLIMGCDGRTDDSFQFCSGIRNVILDFSKTTHTANYRTLIEYIDCTSKLFEGPCFSGNVIMNTVYKLYELGYVSEELYARITHAFQWHKRCGVYLMIEAK